MKRFLATLCVSLAFFLSSCGQEKRTDETTAPAKADEQPQSGGTLNRRLQGDPNTLNFVLHTTTAEKWVLSYLHDALVQYDQKLQLAPGLAERWEVSDDGKVYTFHLQPNATYSDGQPVRASDVVFTLKKIVDPATQSSQYAGLFEGLDPANTKALDDKTAQIAFTRARPAQIHAFNIPVLPEHVYSKGDFKNDFNDTVVGSGPYKLTKFEHGKEVILDQREDYWRKRPFIKTIHFKVIRDDAVAFNALKTGDIDEMRLTVDQWRNEATVPPLKEKIDTYRSYLLAYNFIPWNTKHPLLSDKRVRRALTMAIDRESIVRNVYYGNARIGTGPFTADQPTFNADVAPLPYDLEQSKKLLAEAGLRDTNGDGIVEKNGKPFEIELLIPVGNKAAADQSQIVQDSLRQIGVKLNVRQLDGAQFFERVGGGNFEAAYLQWSLDADPDLYALFHSSQAPPNGQNLGSYSNPDVDRLIIEAREEMDEGKRIAAYKRLHALIGEDQPYTFTVQPGTVWAVNKRVRNVAVAPGFGLFSWHPGPLDWWLK